MNQRKPPQAFQACPIGALGDVFRLANASPPEVAKVEYQDLVEALERYYAQLPRTFRGWNNP